MPPCQALNVCVVYNLRFNNINNSNNRASLIYSIITVTKYLLGLNYDCVQKTKKTNWFIACGTLVDLNQEAFDCSTMVLTARPRRLVI